jgi:hypothetical protein
MNRWYAKNGRNACAIHVRSMHEQAFSFSNILTVFLYHRSSSHLTTVVLSLPSSQSSPMWSLHSNILAQLMEGEKWER